MRALHGPVAIPMLREALGCSCHLGVVPLSTLMSHPASHDGLHHGGSHQHSVRSCTSLLDEETKEEEDHEQSQCSKFHRLQNWGLENTDSSQRVPTQWSLYRTLFLAYLKKTLGSLQNEGCAITNIYKMACRTLPKWLLQQEIGECWSWQDVCREGVQ